MLPIKTLALLALVVPFAGALASEEDPYLWLENVDGEKALDWVREQNRETAERLKGKPLFEELHAQARAVLNSESRLPAVQQKGDQLYNFWRDDEHPRGIYRRTTVEKLASGKPDWETVLDIDALSAAEDTQWVFKGMNCLPDAHRRCLVSLSPGGGDAVVVREFDAKEKRFIEEGFRLPKAKQSLSWIDENSVFVGTDFGEGSLTESGYPRIAKLWKRGTPLAEAQTVHAGDASSVSVWAFRLRSDEGDVDLVYEGLTFWTSKLYQWLDGKLHPLALPASASVEGIYRGRLLISLKDDWTRGEETFPQGAVLIADPAALRGDEGQVELLVEPNESTVVQDVDATSAGILVTVLENVRGRVYRYQSVPEGGWTRSPVSFPDNGALSITSVDSDSGEFFAVYESFLTPPTLYHTAGPDWIPEVIARQEPTFDSEGFAVAQHFAVSKDGTRVPYFLVSPEDLKLDGSHPTHIFSYGGFRNALTPSYSGSYEALSGAYGKLWLERGGVFVLANIRGGGEFGPSWHAAALKDKRHKAFEDFEAVAEDLIERGVTSPEHLGIEGRSNGGLLVGATMTRRPDLYGAVICGVPLLDMKRYHKLLAGASWMAEYGDPDKPEEWAWISDYSPYHNLEADTDYPATFFYTSTRDDRVHPGHARKMAARMEALGEEVWYYENLEGGHGGSSTQDQLAYRLALAYTHLWTQLR